jgi:hypothetical protein
VLAKGAVVMINCLSFVVGSLRLLIKLTTYFLVFGLLLDLFLLLPLYLKERYYLRKLSLCPNLNYSSIEAS